MRPPRARPLLVVLGIVALTAVAAALAAGRADRGDAAEPGGAAADVAQLDPEPPRSLGAVRPPSAGAEEAPCRERKRRVAIDGAPVSAVAVVCRRDGGEWELADDSARLPVPRPEPAEPMSATLARAPAVPLPRPKPALPPESDGSRKAFLHSGVALRLAPGRGRVVTRLAEAYAADGRACRRYVQTARVTGVAVRSEGTVCRDAQGRWRLVHRAADGARLQQATR